MIVVQNSRALVWTTLILLVLICIGIYYLNLKFSDNSIKNLPIQVKFMQAVTEAKAKKKEFIVLYGTKYFDQEDFNQGLHSYPFRYCPYSNCWATNNASYFHESDVILLSARNLPSHPDQLPFRKLPGQLWVFYVFESPRTVPTDLLRRYNGLFDLSHTYHTKSDITNGAFLYRFTKLDQPTTAVNLSEIVSRKSRLVYSSISNCDNRSGRLTLIGELKKHLPIDVYGLCFVNGCTRNSDGRCEIDSTTLLSYKFHLAFENARCSEYITEKVTVNSFDRFTVPIVRGARREEYLKLLPANSVIFADDYTPKTLADYLLYLDRNDTAYMEYLQWNNEYKKESSRIMCNLCRYLNVDEPKRPAKVIDNLHELWGEENNCF